MLFDTHAHLDDEAFDIDREEVIENIRNSPVGRIVNIGSSLKSSVRSVELAQDHDFIYAAVGIHPHEANALTADAITQIIQLTRHPKVVAIGEIGLDYYYDFAPRNVQQRCFIEQIQLAKELALPFVIHSRDATKDTYDILNEYAKDTRFVLHCYSQSREMVQQYVKLGGYISFAGTLTFKNATNLKEAIHAVPLDRLLIETDSPYLSPVPKRGQRNNPTYVQYVAAEAARLLNISFEQISNITTKNAHTFYGISDTK